MKTLRLLVPVAAVCSALTMQAASIIINNDSFELPATTSWGPPIQDWTISGDVGVWDPVSYPSAGLTAFDGNQIGYANAGGVVSQDLNVGLQPNSLYTLSIYVAGRADGYNPGTSYSVDLYAGATLLTSVTPVVPTAGVWTQLTALYASGATVPAGDLTITISAGASQVDFDKAALTVVPEPHQYAIIAGLGLAAFAGYRRFRK